MLPNCLFFGSSFLSCRLCTESFCSDQRFFFKFIPVKDSSNDARAIITQSMVSHLADLVCLTCNQSNSIDSEMDIKYQNTAILEKSSKKSIVARHDKRVRSARDSPLSKKESSKTLNDLQQHDPEHSSRKSSVTPQDKKRDRSKSLSKKKSPPQIFILQQHQNPSNDLGVNTNVLHHSSKWSTVTPPKDKKFKSTARDLSLSPKESSQFLFSSEIVNESIQQQQQQKLRIDLKKQDSNHSSQKNIVTTQDQILCSAGDLSLSKMESSQILNDSLQKLPIDVEKQDPQEQPLQETKYQQRSRQWSEFVIRTFHVPLIRGLHYLSGMSARNPWRTISIISFISIMLLVTGFMTNFVMNTDENLLWTPSTSYAAQHYDWIENHANFTSNRQYLLLIFHNHGKNVLSKEQVRLVFNATDTVMQMPSYNDVCSDGDINITLPNGTALTTCAIGGIMRFWNFSSLLYDFTTYNDEQTIKAMSAIFYPDGAPVDEGIIGKPKRNRTSNMLISATSYHVLFGLPDTEKEATYELEYLKTVLDLNEKWRSDNKTANILTVEAVSPKAFPEEFTRGIYKDIPLVPVVFFMMSAFSCFYFYRKNRLLSRSMLGFALVVSVLVSIMNSYGFLFICGVPFTSMTQLIPFIIFGIGLDDAFMITDAYERTNTGKKPEDRIYDTIEECGFSITLTTITSALSFGIGISSSIPAIKWLCIYACISIVLVLLFQITFYISCIVLDERRIQQRRLDIFCCCQIKDYQDYAKQIYDYNKTVTEHNDVSHRFMKAYAEFILRPKMRVFIVINFLVLLGLCAWSTSKLTQEFDIQEVLPSDSYISKFLDATEEYSGTIKSKPMIYFRNEDFSGEYVHKQMEKYVNDVVAMRTVAQQPTFFWLRDFKKFLNTTDLSNITFNDQLQVFLSDPMYRERYIRDMAFSSDGTLIESRCQITMNEGFGSIKASIGALREQEAVTLAQPINQRKPELSFFTYAVEYNAWSFYSVCVQQLRMSTLSGIGSVTAAAFLLIPHWTAAFIVCPIICMMYIDILGILQWANIHINAVSFVTIVMSIGLIVDYLLHILLRYYETPETCRVRRTSEALFTVGVSVFAGGFSTFLGTMPLILSTSQIFWTVFIAFVTLVSVALAHGLIFLPVILASIGPADNILMKHPDAQLSSSTTSTVRISPISRNGRIERRMSL